MRWWINSVAVLLFLLPGFLVGSDTSTASFSDSLALGANFSNPQVHKGLALGVVNPQLPQVAGVSYEKPLHQ